MLTNITILVIIILGFIFFIILLIVIYEKMATSQKNNIKNRKTINPTKKTQKILQNPINFNIKKSVQKNVPPKTNTLVNSGNNHLRKKLIGLLHGDVDAANRLIAHCQKNHPNKSIDWYLEKVIWDLEKDRRF